MESVYLTDGMTVEVIADGIHLPATILKLVYKLKGVENTCLVTDALAYACLLYTSSVGGRYDWGIGYVGNWSFYFPAGIDAEEEVVYEV